MQGIVLFQTFRFPIRATLSQKALNDSLEEGLACDLPYHFGHLPCIFFFSSSLSFPSRRSPKNNKKINRTKKQLLQFVFSSQCQCQLHVFPSVSSSMYSLHNFSFPPPNGPASWVQQHVFNGGRQERVGGDWVGRQVGGGETKVVTGAPILFVRTPKSQGRAHFFTSLSVLFSVCEQVYIYFF